jgi:hypothetical protein
MLLKVNHIVELQDARYCAAAGVDFISFALDRDSWHHLSVAQVQEILGWLSGPKPVLDFGRDLEEAMRFFHTYAPPAEAFFQFTWQTSFTLPAEFVAEQVILQIPLDKLPEALPEAAKLPFAYLELSPTGDAVTASGANWVDVLSTDTRFLVDIDVLSLDWLRKLSTIPAGVCVRKLVEQSLHQLDFDKFEITLAELAEIDPNR